MEVDDVGSIAEIHENLEIGLPVNQISYSGDDGWMICCNLKVMFMLLGHQTDFTRYSCFQCGWVSSASNKH